MLGLFVLKMFGSSVICLFPVVRQRSLNSLRHVTSLRDSFHDSSHRASHSPLLSDSLLNLSLATRLLARVDLGDLASNSARFCR